MMKIRRALSSTRSLVLFRFNRLAILGLGLCLLAMLTLPTLAAAKEGGWYVGVKAGQAEFDSQLGEVFSQFVDDEQTSYGVGAGYRFGKYFAVEAWYQDLGEFAAIGSPCPVSAEVCIDVLVPTVADLTGVSARALGYIPFGEKFSLYGFLGVIDWNAEVSFDGQLGVGLIDEFSDTDLLYGGGIDLQLTQRLGAFIEYEIFDFEVETSAVGLKLSF